MNQSERRKMISEQIQQQGSLKVTDLCEQFNVSEMTIRRDLRDMDREGLLRRVHGGALMDLGRSYEPPLQVRSTTQIQAKRYIAQKAVDMIKEGDSIALDVGTTTLEIARRLTGKHNLTILTASLPIANEIMKNLSLSSNVRLILTGGIVRSGEHSMTGHIAMSTYNAFNVDKAFIGIGGLSIADGLTEFNLDDALVKKHLIENADFRIVVADSSKLGRTTFANVAPLSSIEKLITDENAPKEFLEELEAMGIDTLVAENLE